MKNFLRLHPHLYPPPEGGGGLRHGLPKNLTTLDLIKTMAVVLMIIDHIGFYFVVPPVGAVAGDPALWWRAVGRLCVPIWFFLIGYAHTRDIPPVLWGGAIVLVLANMVTGMFMFPLNVLVSMILIRLIIDRLGRAMFGSIEGLACGVAFLAVLYVPSNMWFEYGTGGIALALMGWMVRRSRDGDAPMLVAAPMPRRMILTVLGVATIIAQLLMFDFTGAQVWFVAIGMAAVMAGLCRMRVAEFSIITPPDPVSLRSSGSPPPFRGRIKPQIWPSFIKFCGRRTAEIYIGHLVVFKLVALIFGLGYPIYGWFDWDWDIVGAFQRD
jgi:hypothetical protein